MLPRARDTSKPISATQIMLYGMFEAMTNRLRRGDAVDTATCHTIEGLLRRADALRAAYEARTKDAEDEA